MKVNRMRYALAAGTALALAPSAAAQLIVGNDQSGSASIYHIDINTGAATALYTASDSSAKPWGMAYDHDTNTLYWNNGGSLYSSPFSMGGLTPTLLGSMSFNGSAVNFVGLGYRDGVLVGTRNITTEAVYEIDTEFLTATQTYVYPAASFDFGGLDVDATNNNLYGLSDTVTRGLYLIDDTADTTTFKAPYPGSETDIDGLAVYNGLAYYVTDGNNTTQPNFYVFDVESGAMVNTLPSPFTGSGTFAAAAYVVPAPGAATLLGIGGLVAVRRRR